MTDPRRVTPNGPEYADDPGRGRAPSDRLWSAFDQATRGAAGGEPGTGPHERECVDWCPICRGADVVRATATPEMREQWQSIQRDALVAVRQLLDSYIERLDERQHPAGTRVEDIPID